MSRHESPCPDHGEGDEQSRRQSAGTVASALWETGRHDNNNNNNNNNNTNTTPAAEPSAVSAERLSQILNGPEILPPSHAQSSDGDLQEQRYQPAQEGHPNADHVSALSVSWQQDVAILGQHHPPPDAQAKKFADVQTDQKPPPPASSLTDIPADHSQGPPPKWAVPLETRVEDETCHPSWACQVQDVYATTYQMTASAASPFEYGVLETMRREAALDQAIFRPNLRLPRTVMPCERQSLGEDLAMAAIHRTIRKRKRTKKETSEWCGASPRDQSVSVWPPSTSALTGAHAAKSEPGV